MFIQIGLGPQIACCACTSLLAPINFYQFFIWQMQIESWKITPISPSYCGLIERDLNLWPYDCKAHKLTAEPTLTKWCS